MHPFMRNLLKKVNDIPVGCIDGIIFIVFLFIKLLIYILVAYRFNFCFLRGLNAKVNLIGSIIVKKWNLVLFPAEANP